MNIQDDKSKLKERRRNIIIRFGGLAMRDILVALFATCESSRAICVLLGITDNTLKRWLDVENIHVRYEHVMTPLNGTTQEPLTAPAAALAEVEAVIAAENRAKGGG